MIIRKDFKNLDRCTDHDKLFHWSKGCPDCGREKANNMKPIDKVLKKMEEEGMIPKAVDNGK